MVTSSVEDGQDGFEVMVHRNVAEPEPNPVMAEFGSEGFVMEAEPPMSDHTPVPMAGVLAASVVVLPHIFWSGPAFAVLGGSSRVRVTSSVLEVQLPLLTVHLNTLAPGLRAVIPEKGLAGSVMVPAPLTRLQPPVPVTGGVAARVAVLLHTVWSGPAKAVLGGGFTTIVISSVEGGQPGSVILHRSVFDPIPRFITAEFGSNELTMVAAPPTRLHWPVPIMAVFAARIEVAVHIFWSGPAFAAVGPAILRIATLSEEDGQLPLEMVQLRMVGKEVLRFVTVLAGEFRSVTKPGPNSTLQVPVPEDGVLAARVATDPQTV
jgi:hypothetical protein